MVPYSVISDDVFVIGESSGHVRETLIADVIMLQLFELREIQIRFQCIHEVQVLCA